MKIGYEPGPQIARESYGKGGLTFCCGEMIRVKSQAEIRFAEELEMCWQAGAVTIWEYEPQAFAYDYKSHGHQCRGTYTPDFWVKWNQEEILCAHEEVWYEVKRGNITQRAANKIRHFAQQYPDLTIVLVWIGSIPKKGKRKQYFDKAKQHVDHVWYIKMGKGK